MGIAKSILESVFFLCMSILDKALPKINDLDHFSNNRNIYKKTRLNLVKSLDKNTYFSSYV